MSDKKRLIPRTPIKKMLRQTTSIVLLFLLLGTSGTAQDTLPSEASVIPSSGINYPPIVPDKIVTRYVPASSEKLEGWLNAHVRINLDKRLLLIDSATLLSGFVHRPGSQTWIGEHVGKFLSSASKTYRYTHDTALKELADDMVRKYLATQLPDGYMGTYLPKDYWTEWDVWAHKYAIIGLLDYYSVTGYRPALLAAERAGELICRTFGDGPGQKDLNLSGFHAGMAAGSILEPMIDLYRYTANPHFLAFARYILRNWESPTGPKMMSGLTRYGKVTKVGNAKAYEMLSCFVGVLKYYRLTGDQAWLLAMQKAWADIVANRLYLTGTASSFEVFQADHQLPALNKDDMGEGCVTVTWMEFNDQLLRITGGLQYLEEIEKSIYNHLTAAENPGTGCVSYYTPLMGMKPYKCDQGFSCCLSSIPRGISMIPDFVYGRIGKHFSVLLYEPGKVLDSISTDDHGRIRLKLSCATNFPATGDAVYTIDPSAPARFSLTFRIPGWATGFTARVNGREEPVNKGRALTINRRWLPHDQVTIHFNMPLQVLHGEPSYPGYIAFKRGPQVLAQDSLLGAALFPDKNVFPGFVDQSVVDHSNKTLMLQDAGVSPPADWVGAQAYQLPAGAGNNKPLVLTPFADAGQSGGGVRVWFAGQAAKKATRPALPNP